VLLVSIPYWEWNTVKNKGLGAKQEYLKDKLRAAAKGEWEGI
jgi:hypothetical protein